MSNLSNPIFHDDTKAREWLEARVWANGRICPHCGVVDQSTLLQGKSHRPGLYQCNACREPFTVTVGTLYERSKVPLHTWLAVTHLMMASKKGMSALQISRMIGISYKTTWFLCHRIRESLRDTGGLPPMGGENKVVEADETFVGGKASNRAHRPVGKKQIVLSLVEREGHVRSFHIANVTAKTIRPLIAKNVALASMLMTDESKLYVTIGKKFANHGSVNHSADEYARLGGFIHINTAENFFSIVKRGIIGSYHHVSEAHLHRYMAEFDYRYNTRKMTDAERFSTSIPGIVGKRLTYRRANSQIS
ncbi:MAG: IS1595 family transposase [Methylovirgula sp.]|jgi:transposase-like protein